MKLKHAAGTGISLAATVALGYALCSLIFWRWPEAALVFMNALFHGLDFQELQDGASLFSFRSFGYAIVVMSVWAFLLGAVYGGLRSSFED